MALWLVRAGRVGEHEKKFLDENRVYLTWDGLNEDLSQFADRIPLPEFLAEELSFKLEV
jgi:restriction system protein